MTPARAVVAALLAGVLAGCVTERSPVASSDRRQVALGSGPVLPSGQVARPVSPGATTVSQVVVAVRPVGQIPYDGLALPLVSPDARFVATQAGRAPTWPTVLAQDQAVVPVGTRLRFYRLPLPEPGAAPAAGARLTEVTPREPLPSGLLLGRSSDERGFLVESPRPDGARWVGRVEWLTGELTWLVRDDQVNAHATLGPRGQLAWTRRTPGEARAELVYRPRADHPGGELTWGLPDETYHLPTFASDPDRLYIFTAPLTGGDAAHLSLVALGIADATPRFLGRSNLDLTGGLLAAYQAVAATQTPLPHPPNQAAPLEGLLFHFPRAAAVAVADPVRNTLHPLPRGTNAASPLQVESTQGFLCAGTTGLSFVSASADMQAAGSRTIPVLAGGYIPRNTASAYAPFVLLSPPEGGDELIFQITFMTPVQ